MRMARFKYIGGKPSLTAFGYEFEKGEYVEVTDKHHIFKFDGNRFFEREDEGSDPSSMTVSEIKAALEERGVEYSSDDKKADLLKLLEGAGQ